MPKKILLADDSLTIQKVVELTLSGTEYELTCVSNGQKAMESLQASPPDLILADVVMPGKNGYEVCEAVKGDPATAGIPVILLSGTFEPFDRERAVRIGSDLVVSKPFDAHELLERIHALLGNSPPAPPSAASREAEAPFETAFFDDTLDTRPAAGQAVDAMEPNPHGVDHDFSYSPSPETAPAPSPAEQPPAPSEAREPAAPTPREVMIEEISAEEAEVLFDVPFEPEAPAEAADRPAEPGVSALTDAQIERIAALVVGKLSDRVVREIAWEVVPDVAEKVVKRRIEELESRSE
jgi:CheY-like chemotaxis protein